MGTGYENFLFAFARECLVRNEYGYYISLSWPYDYLQKLTESVAPEILTYLGKSFLILDLQTRKDVPVGNLKGMSHVSIADPHTPSQVAAFLERVAKTHLDQVGAIPSIWLLVTISDMAMRFGFSPTYQILGKFIELVRANDWIALAVAHPKMHEPRELAALEHLSDGIIQLTTRQIGTRLQKYLQVTSMRGVSHSSETVPYEIVQGKIALWTRLVEDFEAMKASVTIDNDGNVWLMGTRGQFVSERTLGNLTSIILDKLGYENGASLLYNYTKRTAKKTVEDLARVQNLKGVDILNAYLKVSEVTGSGRYGIEQDRGSGTFVIKGWSLIPTTIKLGKPVHIRDAGAFAGALEFITGRPYEVEETQCISKGDDFCQFTCRPQFDLKR